MDDPAFGKLLGSGKESEVFEYGALVVKLYRTTAPKRSAFREAAILALVESFGLPVPAIRDVRQFEDRWGVTMTRANGLSFADAMRREPSLLPAYLRGMALLQLRVHSHPGTQLASLNARLAANIRQVKVLDEARKGALLDALAALPEGDRLCHGDFHPLNIVGPLGHESLVDWMDASRGDPTADVCRSYVLMRSIVPELASAYVDAYAEVSGESQSEILSWLPFVSAARLAEGVPDEEAGLLEMAGTG
jgi:aminoglycoside phosphotransferase (APT) family kinase protein